MNSAHETEVLAAQSTPLESYVVRIYRRDAHAPSRIIGTVERVADGSERRFRGVRELQAILTLGQPVNALTSSPTKRTQRTRHSANVQIYPGDTSPVEPPVPPQSPQRKLS